MSPSGLPPYDAIVLAGGAGRRLGSLDKPGLLVGGRRLLDRVLAAVPDAGRAVVVGPPRPHLPAGVLTVREHPPGGGPVAAVAAGLAPVSAAAVAVLAGDLPFVTSATVEQLRAELAAAARDVDGVFVTDGDGRDQPLLGVWRTASLRRACAALGCVDGVAVHRLVGLLAVRRLPVDSTDGTPPPWLDCDTEVDLRTAREAAVRGHPA
jgi:molybdopterin-guanine dinucleotide biosynthesis protein A